LNTRLKLVPATGDWHICSDADVLRAVAQQDQQAFSELIARHYQAVYRVAWRSCRNDADSEDVTQEAFLRLWNNPSQLRDGNAVKGWLMRVASNLVMDKFRQRPMQDLDDAGNVADGSVPADLSVDRAHVTARIDEAIATLPERQRLALAMVHFEHMTNIAAAHAMEISVDALESLLARGRRTLKEVLARDGRQLLAACVGEGD
jgi:RNA polymerase sigma-70 factor, ECF subfamily